MKNGYSKYKKLNKSILNSVKASFFVSFFFILIIIIRSLPEIGGTTITLIIVLPFATALISLLSTILILVPSVIFLKKVNLDNIVSMLFISSIIGVVIWLLLDVPLETMVVTEIYSLVCGFAFIKAYEN